MPIHLFIIGAFSADYTIELTNLGALTDGTRVYVALTGRRPVR